MATDADVDAMAREALYLIEKEGVTWNMAKRTALNNHRGISWDEGILRRIGMRMTAIRKMKSQSVQRPKPRKNSSRQVKNFTTHIERSLLKDD